MTNKIYKFNKMWGIVCGGLLLLVAWGVNHSVPSPYVLLHNTECLDLFPPLWLMGLLWFGSYFVVGWSQGLMLSLRPLSAEQNVHRYRGGMLMMLSLSLSVAWYLLLFGSNAFFLSWILLGASVIAGIAAALSCMNLFKGCALLILSVHVGYIFLWILQLMVMLHI